MKILDLDIKLLITIKFLEHIYSCLKQEDYIFPIKRGLEKYKLLIMKLISQELKYIDTLKKR